MPVDITSAAGFSRSLKAEPKRSASSDSISAFEIASFTANPRHLKTESQVTLENFSKISETHFVLAVALMSRAFLLARWRYDLKRSRVSK
jgi:hypothetical protein